MQLSRNRMQEIDSRRPFKETYSKKEKSNEYQDCHRSNLFIPGNDVAYDFLFILCPRRSAPSFRIYFYPLLGNNSGSKDITIDHLFKI